MLAVGAIALAGCTANDDIHAPTLSSVSPTRATAGTSIVLTGSYFCQQPEPHGGGDVDPFACVNMGNVQFGTSPVSPSQYTDTSITVEVPNASQGSSTLSVSVAGRTSNGVEFTIE